MLRDGFNAGVRGFSGALDGDGAAIPSVDSIRTEAAAMSATPVNALSPVACFRGRQRVFTECLRVVLYLSHRSFLEHVPRLECACLP